MFSRSTINILHVQFYVLPIQKNRLYNIIRVIFSLMNFKFCISFRFSYIIFVLPFHYARMSTKTFLNLIKRL